MLLPGNATAAFPDNRFNSTGSYIVFILFKNSWNFVHYNVINALYSKARKQEKYTACTFPIEDKKVSIMYYPYDDEHPEQANPESTNSTPQADTTDRVNGEYHYKNGYTQKIYSDAHYVREDESTVPPKYYTPPEKPVKEAKEPKAHGSGSGWVKIICVALICALLGGFAGGAIMSSKYSSRMDQLESQIAELNEEEDKLVVSSSSGSSDSTTAVSSTDGTMSASSIYDLACQQVVGISSEITYNNYFGMTSSAAVSGSGFIISSDGYIITNYHVIEEAYEGNFDINVMTHDGTKYIATVVGTEQDNDIAVLKIDAEGLNPVTFGDSDELAVGDTVYAVGNPLGELEFSMSTGHVSAKDRAITTEESTTPINVFQIDAAVNSGNSGGPVYNDYGQVVGIVNAKYSATGVEGIGFAIPANDAVSIANDLITKGYVTGKAYMGVEIDTRYSSMYSQYYDMPVGAYVGGVTSGSCAEKAGIEKGDIITKLDGEEITSYTDLKSAISNHSAGDTVEVELYRAGESRTVSLTFDEKDPDTSTQTSGK